MNGPIWGNKDTLSNAEIVGSPMGGPMGNMGSNSSSNTNRDIYYYSEISKHKILHFVTNVREVCKDLRKKAIDDDSSPLPINIYLNSPGGQVFDGLAGYNVIKEVQRKGIITNIIVDGFAASAATFLLIAGSKRFMFQHSHVLIHQLSNWHMGNYEQLKDDMKNDDKIMDLIRQMYLENTKMKKEFINKILQRDLILNASECLKYGLIDEVI